MQLGDLIEGGSFDSRFREIHSVLQGVAHGLMRGQPGGHLLQTTALVNEAYLKLVKNSGGAIQDDAHFLRLTSRAMRQILVDHARMAKSKKRSADGERVELDKIVVEIERSSGSLVALDEALERLERKDPALVELIELRFFAGRSTEEAARILGVAVRTANRMWNAARLILLEELERG